MDDIKAQVGQQIREARKAKGLTMKELGDKISVTESTVSRYEAGKQNVTFEQVQKIANALGLKFKIFFE